MTSSDGSAEAPDGHLLTGGYPKLAAQWRAADSVDRLVGDGLGAGHPFVGSVTWRDSAPFDHEDLRRLAAHQSHVAGAESARLVAVSRSG